MTLTPDLAAEPLAPAYDDRLAFQLKPFLRMAWATPAARDRWAVPLVDLAARVRDAEEKSIAVGMRGAGLFAVSAEEGARHEERWAELGLASVALEEADLPRVRALAGREQAPGAGGGYRLVASRNFIGDADRAWRSGDPEEMSARLGYPPCCAARMQGLMTRGDIEAAWGMTDGHATGSSDPKTVELAGPVVTHPFLRPIGLRTVPHLPCGFHCRATRDLISDYAALRAEPAGADRLEDVLAWPIEWSLLHGIVEIKTAALTLCHEGDATAAAYSVRISGGASPEGGAQGLRFPYRAPARPRRGANAA